MSINNEAFATKFTGELDKILCSKTAVGFMTDNALRAKFVGAKTVKLPSISMQGLGDYDRDTGFIKGSVNVTNTAYTMQQDRARTFSIDREDMDETGIAELAGSVISEFVRTKVVPETDAYTISKLAGLAYERGQLVEGDTENPFDCFFALQKEVQAEVGFDEELVCFVNPYMWSKFKQSEEFIRQIAPGEFKQGDMSFSVNTIDGIAIIPVSASRMQSAYEFLSGSEGEEAGGFTPANGAKGIYMLMLPKRAASLVRKSEKIRIFTPDENISADAYKFDYRLYYDVFVKTSFASGVWAMIAPSVTVTSDVAASKSLTEGSISGSLSVTATASDSSELTYQWYMCSDESKNGAVRIAGATDKSWTIDTSLTSGEYYVFVRITAGGSTVLDSSVCHITVA